MTKTITSNKLQTPYFDTPVDLLTEARMILLLESELGSLKLSPSRKTIERLVAYSASVPLATGLVDSQN